MWQSLFLQLHGTSTTKDIFTHRPLRRSDGFKVFLHSRPSYFFDTAKPIHVFSCIIAYNVEITYSDTTQSRDLATLQTEFASSRSTILGWIMPLSGNLIVVFVNSPYETPNLTRPPRVRLQKCDNANIVSGRQVGELCRLNAEFAIPVKPASICCAADNKWLERYC